MSSKKISKKDTVVLYSGRFQPFHKGHYEVYSFLKRRYDNVFIVTTNTSSKDKKRYPFNFYEKINIMTNLGKVNIHDIYPQPVSNPYSDFYIKKHIKNYIFIIGRSLWKDSTSPALAPFREEEPELLSFRGG